MPSHSARSPTVVHSRKVQMSRMSCRSGFERRRFPSARVAEEAADGGKSRRVGWQTLDDGFPGVARINARGRRDSGLAVYAQEGRTRGARRRLVFFLPLATSGARIRS